MDYRATLRGDCARCRGLCCVGLAFDRSEWFAFDKEANESCQHLTQGFRCGIHGELAARGQAGCAAYDCYGAGQRITQDLFAGVCWRNRPETSALVLEAFRRLKRVHELRLLLHEAGRLTLPRLQTAERERLLAQLEPTPDFSRESLAALELTALETAVHAWLRDLSRELSPERARRCLPLLTNPKRCNSVRR